MKRFMLSLLVLGLLVGIAVPLYAEEVGITLESLAAKLESLTQEMESWTQNIEQLTKQMESVESRLAALEATPSPIPTLIPTLSGGRSATPSEGGATPTPFPTPDANRIIIPGTHLVGIDIQPGLYVGDAGNVSVWDGCQWERLSSLSGGSDSNLGSGLRSGLFYVEVVETDKAFQTTCELLPLDQVPPRAEFLTALPAGMYLIGRDIGPGIYRGQASDEDYCRWARLADARGENRRSVLGEDVERINFLVEVLPTDYAFLVVGCSVVKVG